MNFSRKTIGTFCLIAVCAAVLPPATFAQQDRQEQRETERQERLQEREERREQTRQLRERADELRSRYLNSTTTPGQEQTEEQEIETQDAQESELDRVPWQEKIQEFKQAQEAAQQDPQAIEGQKALLLHALDSLTEHAHLLEHKANRFPVMSADLKASLEAELEAELAVLDDFQDRVQEAATLEELRQLGRKIKQHRADTAETKMRKLMLLAHTEVFEYRVLNVTSNRASAIGQRLQEFKADGKNTQELEELLEEADQLIAEASTDLDTLRQDVVANSITTQFMQELQADFHNIQQEIGDTYGIFRQIAQQAAKL